MAEKLFKIPAHSGKFIQDGGGSNENDVVDNACEDVGAKVGRLRKHSVLKSD